jgi:23S rRNA pseudouridine1911/1915/1917 synthase
MTDTLKKPFEIIFEDQHLIVLSKAPGVLSQGDISGEENLVDLLRVYFGRNYVGLLHRLDRNTSGLMIVAKRSKSAERLTEQLQNGTLVRKYRAILEGTLAAPAEWKHSLLKNEKTNEVRVVPAGSPGAKTAALKVKPVKTFLLHGDSVTLAEFELETGRSHQIRVQSAAMKHPLIGDTKYGSAHGKNLFPRPALHSCYLEFEHPITKEKLKYFSLAPADWPDQLE